VRYSLIFLISQSGTKRTVPVTGPAHPEYKITRVAQIEPENLMPFYLIMAQFGPKSLAQTTPKSLAQIEPK
jgi:hypothetical protein